jgi:hypothetical protein
MFLSFYCDYIVDEFIVFVAFFQIFFSEIINFRWPPEAAEREIGSNLFLNDFGG